MGGAENIILRPATAGDAAACAAVYAPYVRDTVITFEVDPPTEAEMADRISAASIRHSWLVMEAEGRVLGYANAGPHMARAAYDRTAFVGIYMAPEACGRGLGRRLYAALIDDLAAKGFHALLGCITMPNDPSVALHLALGFTKVGHFREVGWKQDRWLDVGLWQRLL